jgi:hypothetical protein
MNESVYADVTIIMKAFFTLIIVVTFLIYPSLAQPFQATLAAGRLTIRANRVNLQNILMRLSDQGTRVLIAPQINPLISAHFVDRDIQTGLESILQPYSHVLVWEEIKGSVGVIERVAEIHVFEPGKKGEMQPIQSRDELHVVVDPKTGISFIVHEIILRADSKMTVAEFEAFLKEIGGSVIGGSVIGGSVIGGNQVLGIFPIRFHEKGAGSR